MNIDGMLSEDGVDIDHDGDDEFDSEHLQPSLAEPDGDALHSGWIGPPVEETAEYWHPQERMDSCAVASQEFILDDFTGVDHTEAELSEVAEANGWYTPGGGTSMDDVGKVLEHYGIQVEQQHGATLTQLEQALHAQDGVIVGLDADEIWAPGRAESDEPLDAYPGIAGQGADHAVQVIGLNYADSAHPTVVLNDPGVPDGQAKEVPLEQFMEAWEDSGYFMVTADRPDPGDPPAEGWMTGRTDPLGAITTPEPTLHEVRFGYSYTVPGQSEKGNSVAWSTSTNSYFDEKTWEPVEPA